MLKSNEMIFMGEKKNQRLKKEKWKMEAAKLR